MSRIYFSVEDNVVIKRTPAPEIGEYVYREEIVMDKETFQECYKKWIEPQEGEVTE